MLLKRTFKDIFENAEAYLKKTGSTAVRIPGTPEHAMANLAASEIAALYNSLERLSNGLTLSTATAADLDDIAEQFGITRGDSQTAYDHSGSNVKFYIDPRLFKTGADIKSAYELDNLTIPANTEVKDGQGRIYYVTEDATIPDDGDSIFVKVTAAGSGSAYNVDAGTLTRHNLSAHQTLGAVSDVLMVTNLLPIDNGTYAESDSDLRYRITQHFASAATSNETAILQTARSVAGVADAYIMPNLYGTGTFGVFVESTTPIVSPGIINAVQSAIDINKAAGTRGFVLYPDYIGLQMTFDVMFDTATNSETAITTMRKTVTNYVNNLSRGGVLSINKLISTIAAFREVKNVQLVTLKSGYYDILTQSMNNVNELLLVDQQIGLTEKWFTASDLITICEVS